MRVDSLALPGRWDPDVPMASPFKAGHWPDTEAQDFKRSISIKQTTVVIGKSVSVDCL